MSSRHRQGVCDADGHLYLQDWFGTSIRCARLDGMLVTIVGDNFYSGDLELQEGPASCLPALDSPAQHFGSTVRTLAVRGSPWQGEEKGAIYLLGGRRSGNAGKIYKVWRNPTQNNRWWFRHVGGGGKRPLPTREGESLPALEAALDPAVRFAADLGGADQLYLNNAGSAYRFDVRTGTLTCVLSYDSYRDKVRNRKNSPLGPAEEIVIADDGTAYLNYYRASYPGGMIWRVSPDRRQVELIVSYGEGNAPGDRRRFDGSALGSYWFGGPQMNGYQPPHLVLAGAVDDRWLRRYHNGRISTLCPDGEWREFATRGDALKPPHLYAGFGTNGWAMYRNSPYVYRTYGSTSDGANTIIRFGPVDWHKPTVGPLLSESK